MPEIKFLQALMLVMVTSSFDDNSVYNEQAGIETKLSEAFVKVLITCKYVEDSRNIGYTPPNYTSMGYF